MDEELENQKEEEERKKEEEERKKKEEELKKREEELKKREEELKKKENHTSKESIKMELNTECEERLLLLAKINKVTREEWITNTVNNFFSNLEKRVKKDPNELSEQTLLKLKALAKEEKIDPHVWLSRKIYLNCPHTQADLDKMAEEKKKRKNKTRI